MANFNVSKKDSWGLVVLFGGDLPADPIIKNTVKESLYCICADGGTRIAYECDRIPDLLVGDMDSIDHEGLEWCINNNVRQKKYEPEKDYTDGEIALDFAIKIAKDKAIKRITVIGAYGNRLDHMLANLLIGQKVLDQGLEIVYLNDNSIVYLLSDNSSLKIKSSNGRTVSLLPMVEKVFGVTLKGFKYLLEDAEMTNDRAYGISNEMIAENGSISLKKGRLMVVQNRVKV